MGSCIFIAKIEILKNVLGLKSHAPAQVLRASVQEKNLLRLALSQVRLALLRVRPVNLRLALLRARPVRPALLQVPPPQHQERHKFAPSKLAVAICLVNLGVTTQTVGLQRSGVM